MLDRFYALYSLKWGKEVKLTPNEIMHIEEIEDRDDSMHCAVADYCMHTLNGLGVPHPIFLRNGYRRGLLRIDNSISISIAKYHKKRIYIYKEREPDQSVSYRVSCNL